MTCGTDINVASIGRDGVARSVDFGRGQAPGNLVAGSVPSQDGGHLKDSPPPATSNRRGPIQVSSLTCSSRPKRSTTFMQSGLSLGRLDESERNTCPLVTVQARCYIACCTER